MQVNIKAIFEQKRYLVLFLLFTLGAYAAIQSVLTRGEVQYAAKNVEIPLVDEVKSTEESEEANVITPEVLGDRVVNEDNFFGAKQPNLLKKLADKPKVSILTDENEAPKIVLGYKEGLNEAWDICSDIELAKSFGFDTSSCQSNDNQGQLVDSLVINNNRGGGGGGQQVVEPIPVEEAVIIPPTEPEAYTSSSQALLTSFKIGGQEVMGKRGSEPMSRTGASYKSGVMLKVLVPYTFTGIELDTIAPVNQIVVYIYQEGEGWSTWALNYPEAGGEEALATFLLKHKATVVVKVVSEDLSTTNWYKAKVFDPEDLDQIPDFLTKFQVGDRDVLPLLGLSMDYHSLNMVDFGASLLVPDFTNFKGVKVELNNFDNFVEAKVLIYRIGWSTWDLKYPGAIEDLANTPINKDEIIILKLKDTENNIFYYRVNVFEGLEEATEVEQINDQTEVSVPNADSSLKDLLVGDYAIDLETANVGSNWYTTSTGAVLTVDSFDNLIGVMPQASDENSTIKVRIYRNVWITWEYEVGLDLVAKEQIMPNDRIVIEVTAEDGTTTYYYQVQVTLKTEVENPPIQISPESVSADEAVKPEPVEELKPETTDNDQPEPELKKEVEKVAEEISTDSVKIE